MDWTQAADATGTTIRAIYTELLALRQQHASLRSPNFYPDTYDWSWTQFGPDGYGIDVGRQLVIYHRYGATADGKVEHLMVALNFTRNTQNVDIPFPVDGTWTDLINGNQTTLVSGNKLSNWPVPSNWGCVFWINA
jgi:pullulanase